MRTPLRSSCLLVIAFYIPSCSFYPFVAFTTADYDVDLDRDSETRPSSGSLGTSLASAEALQCLLAIPRNMFTVDGGCSFGCIELRRLTLVGHQPGNDRTGRPLVLSIFKVAMAE